MTPKGLQVIAGKLSRSIEYETPCWLEFNILRFLFWISSCRLEEAEDKYKNRESRDEDLEMIAYLKEMMSEKEQMLLKLNVWKFFFSCNFC